MTLCFMDWLTVSFPLGYRDTVGVPGGGHSWIPAKGRWGYDIAHGDELTGMVRLSSTTRPDMGTAYVLSGAALERLQSVMFEEDRIEACVNAALDGGRASRLDLAIDVADGGFYARRLPSLVRSRRFETTTRSIRFIEGIRVEDGCTTYLGSRKSAKFIRVYDKSAESAGAIQATRIEVQLGAEFANGAWYALALSPRPARGAIVTSIFNGFVKDWADAAINQLFSDEEPFEWAREVPGTEGTRRWLARQVAPTFVKEYRTLGHTSPTWSWFQDLVATMMLGDGVDDVEFGDEN